MAPQPSSSLDLTQVFQAVNQVLADNQDALNEADPYNHDHGTNMVDIFQTITQAMQEKPNATPSAQLKYASKKVGKQASGSAQLYSQGLADAAAQFKGRQITTNDALQLIASLLGGAQASGGQDMLGSLLSGSMGGEQQPEASAGGQDVLGSLLSGLMGGTASEQAPQPGQPQGGLDLGGLLGAGLSILQASQQGQASGGSPLETIIGGLLSNGPMSDSPYRKQSGSLVANTLLQVIASLAKQ